MYDPVHHLLFCRHAKAASSTWLAIFLSLRHPGASYSQARLHAAVPRLFQLPPSAPPLPLLAASIVSFSMVRHPFERLVSAYQDKVMGGTAGRNTWAADLLRRRSNNTSFPSFLSMVVEQAARVCPSPGVRPCGLNPHWRPYMARCS